MPSSFAKVTKRVTKKKGAAKTHALHENSRDAHRLRRASARDDKVTRMAAVREKANESYLLRVSFMQACLPSPARPLSEEQMRESIAEYLSRNDGALDEVRGERRPGRPMSARQVLLEQGKEHEAKEYEVGFWLPDLRDEVNVEKLAVWKGDWAGLGQIKFVRVAREGVVRDSAFPPTGAA